jgi:hypothetical protein
MNCAYCERKITAKSGRLRSAHTGEVYCLRPDCWTRGKKLRVKRGRVSPASV